MGLFGKSLPADDWASLRVHLGRRPRVLAWAKTDAGVLVGVPDRLCERDACGWHEVSWHEVLRGGWDAKDRRFRWTTVTAPDARREVLVIDPGRLPELFRERVEQSIVVSETVDLGGGRLVVVAGRRPLVDGEAPVEWIVVPGRGVDLSDPSVAARAQAELGRVREEWA